MYDRCDETTEDRSKLVSLKDGPVICALNTTLLACIPKITAVFLAYHILS